MGFRDEALGFYKNIGTLWVSIVIAPPIHGNYHIQLKQNRSGGQMQVGFGKILGVFLLRVPK